MRPEKNRLLIALFLLILSAETAGSTDHAVRLGAGSTVQIGRRENGWTLTVDGKPFWIKGVGCNHAQGENGEDYLLMVKKMGANAVRTWYQIPVAYLDKADRYGLKVNVGLWLPPIRKGVEQTYRDASFRESLRADLLKYVRETKAHPAILAWTVGNEVFAFTEKESERIAFAAFLNGLIESIRREDPNHPVIYACAGPVDLPYLKNVPALDVIGINAYGGLSSILKRAAELSLNKPIVITEFGPVGGWAQPKDPNGVPYDPLDQLKAANYVSMWRQIEALRDKCLGGFAFVLGGPRNQDSLTWFNLNVWDHPRQAYWALFELFTGQPPPNRCPIMLDFQVKPTAGVKNGSVLELTSKVKDPEQDKVRLFYRITDIASDPIEVASANFIDFELEEPAYGSARLIPAFSSSGVYRVYVFAIDDHGNAAVANRSIRVDVGGSSNQESSK